MKKTIVILFAGVMVLATQKTFADDNVLRIMSVTIDQNSTVETVQSLRDNGSIVSIKSGQDPYEIIKEKDEIIQQLNALLNAKKARSEPAKAVATVNMRANQRGNFALNLDIDDQFEIDTSTGGLTSVSVITVNEGGIIVWPAFNSTNSMPQGTDDTAGVGVDSTSNQQDGKSVDPVKPKVSLPEGIGNTGSVGADSNVNQPSVTNLDPFKPRNSSKNLKAKITQGVEAILDSFAPNASIDSSSLQTSSNDPLVRKQLEVQLKNVHDVTFSYPAPLWEVEYELRDNLLFQWARIGNFTGVAWPAGTAITLTDVNRYNDNQKITFILRTNLDANSESLQLVGTGMMYEESFRYRLGDGTHPKRFLEISRPTPPDLSQFPFFPAGQLRSTLATGTSQTGEVSYMARDSKFNVGVDRTIQIKSETDLPLEIGKVLSVDGGIFEIESLRRSRTSILHAGIPQKAIDFEKNADPDNWSLVDSDWTLDPTLPAQKYLTTNTLDPNGKTNLNDLVEAKIIRLDFYNDEHRDRLAKLAEANIAFRATPIDRIKPSERPKRAYLLESESEILLNRVLGFRAAADKLKPKIEALNNEIAKLNNTYDEYDVGHARSVGLGKQVLRGIKERIIRLDIEKENVEQESSRLTVEIDANLFPVLESPSSSGQGFYSLVK